MALIYHSGYVFKDDGTAVEGATVQLYQTDSTTLVTLSDGSSTSTTTNSSGYYSASVTEAGATSGYDVKITSGSSVRYRRGNDRLQLEELDIRNDTGNTQGALYVANTTNNASNKVATFASMNSTRADSDEIYISFELANSAGTIHEFARITAEAVDVTDGQEDGQLRFGVVKTDGSISDVFTINSTTGGATSMTFDVSDDINLDADGGDIFFKDGGTTFGSATNNSGNLIIKSGTTTALTFTGSSVAVAGDLTITGDDLVMGTNTSGHILVADGTNFNPVAAGGDITIAANGTVTIANDAITSAKIADDAITSALIADDAITTALIADDAITSALIADGAVTTALIGADAVDATKIADDAIDSEHYTDASVDFAHIQNVAANSILGRNANSSGVLSEVALATTQILIGDGTGFTAAALSGDVTMANDGAVTIASGAVEHGMLADDIVSGQAEITSGFAAADELMYSDGGVIKRVGLDVLATKLFSVATAGTVAQASDHMLFLDAGATGDVIVESIDDFLSAIAGSGISVSSSQLTASGGISESDAIALIMALG